MEVKIDSQALLAELQKYLEWPEIATDLAALKSEIDIGQKTVIALGLIEKMHAKADTIIGDVQHLADDEEALDVVVGFLDGIIRLPIYLEWLDGPVIKAIVKMLAGYAKKVKVA